MKFFIITSFITAFTSISLGIFVYFKNKRNPVNYVFSFFSIAVFIWSFSYGIWLLQKDYTSALFWSRTLNASATFIPITYLHWILVFLKKHKRRKIILSFGYALTFLFLLFSFTPYYIKEVKHVSIFPYWPQANWLYLLYIALSYFGMFFYGLYLLYKKFKITTGYYRDQIKYVFLGLFIGGLGGATNFPLMIGIDLFPPFGNPLVIAYPLLFSYAIVKYRLMDIRVVIKRSIVFLVIFVLLTFTYTLAAFLLTWLVLKGTYNFKDQLIVGIVVSLIIAIGFRPFYDWTRKATDTFLFKGEYRPQKLIAEISNILSETLNLNIIINALERKISQALRLEKMRIIVLEENGNPQKIYQSKEEEEQSLKNIISYFKENANRPDWHKNTGEKTIVLEEMKRKVADKVKFEKSFLLIEDMEKIGAAVVVPLFFREKLVGLFLLSAKISSDTFTSEDIRVLEIIAAQAAIAFNNALSYEEIQKRKADLEKFYKLTVGRELRMIELKKRIRELEEKRGVIN